jgi:hypothetical protein
VNGERIAGWIVGGLTLYAIVGVVFALLFVVRGVQRIDPVARQSSWGFRAMIFPGSVALWPLLLRRWLRGLPPPAERNAHRNATRGDG